MRFAWLFALAACSRGWQPATPIENDPEPDSQTVYTDEPIVAQVRPSTKPPIGTVTCGPLSNMTAAAIHVVAHNHTSFEHDLCDSVNAALGRIPNIAAFAPAHFTIHVTLRTIEARRDVMQCRLGIMIGAQHATVGVVNGGSNVAAASTTTPNLRTAAHDCIDALIADLIERQVAAAMQAHVATLAAQPATP